MRDFLDPQGGEIKLFPYAKDLQYDQEGRLSMTIQVYDTKMTQEFSFGFNPSGNLKMFLDQIYLSQMEE